MGEVTPNASPQVVAAYLRRIPGYAFDPEIDEDFVDELLKDFAALDVLEEIKAFRWYHDNRPAQKVRHVRLSLRRWLAGTLERRSRFPLPDA